MEKISDENLKKQYTDRVGAVPSGLVKILRKYGDFFTVFGFLKFKRYIKSTDSFLCIIHDMWGQAAVFIEKTDFQRVAKMWQDGNAVCFDAVYQNDYNNRPTLKLIKFRNPFNLQAKMFDENFKLYKLYWDVKHIGKPRKVNIKTLIKNDLRLLKWALANSPIYYKERESFEGRKKRLMEKRPNSEELELLERATPTNYETFYGSPTAQLSRLQDFDLMVCLKHGSGVWQITNKGIKFLMGEIPSPTKAVVTNWGEGEKEREFSDPKYLNELCVFDEEEFKNMVKLAKQKQAELFEGGDIYEE